MQLEDSIVLKLMHMKLRGQGLTYLSSFENSLVLLN